VLYFAQEMAEQGDITGLFEGLMPLIAQIFERVRTVLHAIHDFNPTADVAWLLYPNYGRSEAWAAWVGEALQPTVIDKLEQGLNYFRDSFQPEDRVLLVDLFAAWGEVPRLDDYLVDELHFNPVGHSLVADEFLKAFGASRVGGDAPFGQDQDFGLSAVSGE
jgi:lysophospholipase L1-like esterase